MENVAIGQATWPRGRAQPLVSCLMVTSSRVRLAERAVQCFCRQTWANKELVIIDDGDDDYTAMLRPYSRLVCVRYERVKAEPGRLFLGGLRNLSLDRAAGDYCAQWDDDEWHHPERIEAQMRALPSSDGGSVLRYTLMHLDLPAFVEHPYRTGLRNGTPGTVIHSKSTIRYPNQRRGEDSAYLQKLRGEQPVSLMGAEFSLLFIRCYHGDNTWHVRHFRERLWRNPRNKLEYLRARYIKRDLWSHPAFHLNELERSSVGAFRAQSRELGLA